VWCLLSFGYQNDLAQQASGSRSNREKPYVLEKLDVPVCHSGCSDL
jgi:hypothetical protein